METTHNHQIIFYKKCPCKLADCPIYQQTPVRTKATSDNTFFIQTTASDYRMNPTYAVLGLVNTDIDEETLCAALDQLKQPCQDCRANKESKYPSCIRVNLLPWIAVHGALRKR